MAKKSTETLVGVFVLLGIIALAFLALKAANLASFNTAKTYTVRARFDNIGGLKKNAPVRSAGVSVGQVTSITLDKNTYQGLVIMKINEGMQFPVDSSAKILTAGLLGDSFIEIKPSGKETTTFVEPGATISGESSKLANLQETADKLAKKVDTALDDISITVTERLGRKCASSGSKWEPKMGYSRAVRSGNLIAVTGTVGVNADGKYSSSLGEQTRRSLQIIQAAIDGLGVAIGRTSYVEADIAQGRLVVPFDISLPMEAGFYLVYPPDKAKARKLVAFREWLMPLAHRS